MNVDAERELIKAISIRMLDVCVLLATLDLSLRGKGVDIGQELTDPSRELGKALTRIANMLNRMEAE